MYPDGAGFQQAAVRLPPSNQLLALTARPEMHEESTKQGFLKFEERFLQNETASIFLKLEQIRLN